MIVRRYEIKGEGSFAEFWINDNKVCVSASDGDVRQTSELDYEDVKDLITWLKENAEKIAPTQNG